MDKVYIKEILAALRTELVNHRFIYVFVFIGLSFGLLGLGALWPKTYTTQAVLFADVTNIIEPLLKGSAEITKIDRSEQASEVIYTQANLLGAAKTAGLINNSSSEDDKEDIIRAMRGRITIERERNQDYFRVSYDASDPDKSFEGLNAIINTFIDNSEKKKRAESVGAYNFIDAQVQTYKKQLEQAEEKLKDFKSKNLDGTEDAVNARIASLRQDLESLKIAIEEAQSRVNTINQQLSNEGHYLQAKSQLDELNDRRQKLNGQLEQLLLSYQEGYPDVISLRAQIAELDTAIEKLKSNGDVFGNSEKVENPLYEELRKQLADADVDVRAKKRRMESLKDLQKQEYERKQRIAASQAQLSELTRDYDVTRKIYEEMLRRKEAARLSMTLDIEGQGVSYRIQEPAAFPLKPSGLRFIHFAVVAPFFGLMVPFGLLILYVLIDPRLRSARVLVSQLPEDIPLVAVVPHFNTPLVDRLIRKDMVFIVTLSFVAMAAYVAVAVFWQIGHD